MKKIFVLSILTLTLLNIYWISYFIFNKNNPINSEILAEEPIFKRGIIYISNIDSTGMSIENSEFKIIDFESGKTIQTLTTDENGFAKSNILYYGTVYVIEQISAPSVYEMIDSSMKIELSEDIHEIVFENKLLSHIKNVDKKENGKIEITELYLPVDIVMQNPELPNGCEITSLTAVLNFHGYDISKTHMADNYLDKVPFSRVNGKLYGGNPYEAFAGDPTHSSGFFVYGPPIAKAANNYFQDIQGNNNAIDISGSTSEEIIEYLNQGLPVVIWVTLDLSHPRLNYSWYIKESNDKFIAPVNLHAVVLKGYSDGYVHIMDPLKGHVTHEINRFFLSYNELGSHSVLIVEN
ncbi:uncharacterized protein YvpB [Acetoanaerobium pronyense]|uniref:Uncharacterized protein YvpB n=1 Tax=Acetoanaerobium pronyense TaxID=1482736 RepID=A0ABS4KMR2_9FIRM|nr:C39 family peptidase [Acetoanaerobium pronyense]MBP2028620.1 uncharacterized protein YvpB [Acetoanaerobium pronyense]